MSSSTISSQTIQELNQSRKELDQITRQQQSMYVPRTQAQATLPTVPELPTPGGVSPSNSFDTTKTVMAPDLMSQSKLFQHFSSKRSIPNSGKGSFYCIGFL